MALLARALPARLQPVETLKLRQHLRGGGRRHHRLLGEFLDAEPVLMLDQQGVKHLRAPPGKQRSNRLRQGLGWRLVDVEIHARGGQEQAAAAVVVPDVAQLLSSSLAPGEMDSATRNDTASSPLGLSGLLWLTSRNCHEHFAHISRIDSLFGLDQQGERLTGDVQVDLGVMPTVAGEPGGSQVIQVGMHLRQRLKGSRNCSINCRSVRDDSSIMGLAVLYCAVNMRILANIR